MSLKRLLVLTVMAGLASARPAGAQLGVLGTPTADSVTSSVAAPAESREPLRLEVSLEERRLYVLQGEEVRASYSVAVGKPNHPTPAGEFRIRRVIWNPRWVPPKAGWAKGKKPRGPGDPANPMGRVKMFFQEPDYYIHGTNNEQSLGGAESHGCIRMANEDVVQLAQLVMEHGGEPREPSWFQRILNRVRRSSEVRLSEPVTVVIRP